MASEETEVKQPQLLNGLIPASNEPQSLAEKLRREGAGNNKGSVRKRSRELSEKLQKLDADPAMALAKLMKYVRPIFPPPCDYQGCSEFATRGAAKRPGLRYCDEHAVDGLPLLPIAVNPNADKTLYKEVAIALLPYAYSRLANVQHDISGGIGNVMIQIIPAGGTTKMLDGDIDGEVIEEENE